MRQPIQQMLLMLAPLAVAAAVGVGSPWLQPGPVDLPAAGEEDVERTLANACEAHQQATEAAAPSEALRQQQRAAVERCVRIGQRVIQEARAGG